MKVQNKNYTITNCIFITALLATFSSCQKLINVDLNSGAPKIVIDASITDQPGPYTVVLSQTVDFSETNTFPPVTGANITLGDNAGNAETLTETSPGTYVTSTLQGVPGRTYNLNVNVNNHTYSASSTMPLAVNIDSLTFGNTIRTKDKTVIVHFMDPIGKNNYYHLYETLIYIADINKDHGLPTLGQTVSDRLHEGTEIDFTLSQNKQKIFKGDSLIVYLECIDKAIYDYFKSTQQGSSLSTTLSNPVTNLSNGALGYFSACSVRKVTSVVP